MFSSAGVNYFSRTSQRELVIARLDDAMGWAEMKAAKAKKPGQWNCAGCYVINEPDVIECISCETPKPGKEEEVKAAKAAKKAAMFAPKPAAAAAPAAGSSGGFSFGVGGAAAPAASTGGFSFGVGGGAAPAAAKPAATTGGFKFGAAAAAPKPAAEAKPAAAAAPAAGGWAAMKAAKAMKDGQWKCAGCYVINEASEVECVSCETVRPGKEEEAKAKKAAAAGAFSFGVGPGAASAAKSASPAAPAAPTGGFTFGAAPTSTAAPDGADGGGKRQKGSAPASTSISVTIEGDGKLGLVFVAGSEPPVVKAVSEDGLAAKAGDLKVGLVLTHVQGTAVASMSHDEAKELIKNASRPLALVFSKKDPASSSNGFSFGMPKSDSQHLSSMCFWY
jgi:Zn-finger protein